MTSQASGVENSDFDIDYLGFDDWDDDDLSSFEPTSNVTKDRYYQEHGYRKNSRAFNPSDVRFRLRHILVAKQTLRNQIKHGESVFFSDTVRGDEIRKICERCIEIIAEASAAIHSDYKERFDVPWRDLYAMRNIIAHSYHQVDNEIVWVAITESVPQFLEALGLWDTDADGEIPMPDGL
jgi:uncharacterized protein with HEPN domain